MLLGCQFSTQTTSSSLLDTALLSSGEELGLAYFGVMEALGNAGGRGKDQPGVASLGCSCCLYTPAPELHRARDLKRNFSAS